MHTHLLVLHLKIFSKEAPSVYAGVGYSERRGVTEVTMAIKRQLAYGVSFH